MVGNRFTKSWSNIYVFNRFTYADVFFASPAEDFWKQSRKRVNLLFFCHIILISIKKNVIIYKHFHKFTEVCWSFILIWKMSSKYKHIPCDKILSPLICSRSACSAFTDFLTGAVELTTVMKIRNRSMFRSTYVN